MLSSITPPVALAAYAAAGIAKSNPLGIAVQACLFGIAAFIVPYLFAYNPALLGVDTDAAGVVTAAITAIIGALSLAAAVQGWLLSKLHWIERIGFLIVAGLMIAAGWKSDVAGMALLIVLVLWQRVQHKRSFDQQTLTGDQ